MSKRVFFLSAFLLLVPGAFAYGAGIIPYCPESGCRACDLVTLANNVIRFLISMSAILAVIALIFVGFNSITSGESGAHKLKSAFTNIVIGILIMLSGWLVVDTVLKVLIGGSYQLGPWHSIQCINNPSAVTPVNTGGGVSVGGGTGTNDRGTGGPAAQCSPDNPACSVEALKAAGMSDAQANAMSCIAMTESTGNPTVRSTRSSACGTFQVLEGSWKGVGSCSSHSSCTDANCNAQAALALMNENARTKSAYSAWTCPNCNSQAQNCVDRFDPGH